MIRTAPAFTLLLLFTASTVSAAAPGGSTSIVQGNELYRRGEYAQAAGRYLEALGTGYGNGHVHYNLANAYYRLGEIGSAIAQYRRALQLLPGDPDVLANLNLARRKTRDRIEETPSSLDYLDKLLFPRTLATEYRLKTIFLVLYCAFWLCFLLLPIQKVPPLKTATQLLFLILVYWTVLTFGAQPDRLGRPTFALTPQQQSIRPAVVTAEEVKAHSGDSENFQVVFILHEGAEVQAGERRGDWIELLLPNNRRGWVQQSHVEIL